ncbi:Pre-mRNA-splicing factor SPP2, partial [Choanephora cucurbitarum]
KFENKRAIFGDDDEEEERTKDERVLGIEDNQIKEAEPKQDIKPLSISPLPNTDWRANARQNKDRFIPVQQNQQEESRTEILDQSNTQYGLQIQRKAVMEHTSEVTTKEATITSTTTTTTTAAAVESQSEMTKTLEERAVDAILKESMGEVEEEHKGPKKVIALDEAAAFKKDVDNRPDETTMEDYENIPVEEFGAALLRGLGWSEGEGIGRNRKSSPAPPPPPIKQRDALLGLGAKPEESDRQSQQEKARKKRAAYEYKDTSLFKKISKRKIEDALDDNSRDSSRSSVKEYDDHRRYRDDDRRSRSSHSSSSKRRRSRSSDRRHRSSSSNSSSSSRRHRSRSRDSSRHKSSSSNSKSKYDS